jgi:hypothetical protein
MTTKEIRLLVAKSPIKSWFEGCDLTLQDALTSESLELKGIPQIHSFITKNIAAWRELESLPQFAQMSLSAHEEFINNLESLVGNFHNGTEQHSPQSQWNRFVGKFHQQHFYNFQTAKAAFLIQLNISKPSAVQGAYNYFTNHYSINSKNDFEGFILAYEFENQERSAIFNKRKIQLESTKNIHSKITKYQQEIEQQLTEHLAKAIEESIEHSEEIDELYNAKRDLIEKWFEQVETDKDKTMADAKARITELENTYTELLRLKKPADYWKKRAEKLKAEGWRAVHWLIGLVCVGVVALYSLLWLTPEGMLLSFIQGKEQAIKWSVVYITFLSFLAYGIRALNKIAFSSFHLARDAEEREQLTYFYLSLIDDSAVDEKDKSLIMQSLFSRAETGLLKDESGPTMPSEMTSRILNNK